MFVLGIILGFDFLLAILVSKKWPKLGKVIVWTAFLSVGLLAFSLARIYLLIS